MKVHTLRDRVISYLRHHGHSMERRKHGFTFREGLTARNTSTGQMVNEREVHVDGPWLDVPADLRQLLARRFDVSDYPVGGGLLVKEIGGMNIIILPRVSPCAHPLCRCMEYRQRASDQSIFRQAIQDGPAEPGLHWEAEQVCFIANHDFKSLAPGTESEVVN